MQISLLVSFLALSVLHLPTFAIIRCGTRTTMRETDAAERLVGSTLVARDRVPFNYSQPVSIDIYIHIIKAGEGIDNGNIPDSDIDLQMKVLNKAFHSTGFQFVHKGTSRTLNHRWFRDVNQYNLQDQIMKRSLRVGGSDPSILNVYTVGISPEAEKAMAYSALPWESKSNPTLDGVVMLHSAFAGGSLPEYNSGLLLAHEVGHWVGLLHTFHGGCFGRGDYVDDTPNEKYWVYSCEWRKTCYGPHSSDSIDNIMSYSPEWCQTRFTPGQAERMQRYLRRFRNVFQKVASVRA